MQKVTILFLIPTLGHGGAEKVLINLVNHLNQSKYEITVQTLFSGGVNEKYLNKNIRYKSWISRPFRGNSKILSIIPARWLYRYIIKDKYDIVISYLEGPTAHIVSGCPYFETKIVQWIHIELNTINRLKTGFLFLEKAIQFYKKCDKLVFVAKSVLDCFERTVKLNFSNAIVLYNTIETNKILTMSEEAVTDISFSTKTINVCSVAKIIPAKGFDRLVRVHKRLINEGVDHHIYILGIGPQQREIEVYLEKYNLENSFTFVGYRENPYKYVAACDLYICSSRREGFSTAVTEALIVGTPVVSTNCSGSYELLGNNNEYGIVTDNSEDGIYKGLKRMISDNKLREYYSEKAKERGRMFSTKNTVDSVDEMLMGL